MALISLPPSPRRTVDIIRYLDQLNIELQKLNTPEVNTLQIETTFKEPNPLRDGLIANADGTLWDPGMGAGVYRYDEGTTTWQYFEVSSGGSGGNQNLWETITSDSGSTVADITTDTLSILGAGIISTSISGDTLTISSTGNPDQNLFLNVVSDSGTATANITTDTLSILGGTGVSTAIAGDILTITASADQNLWETITSDLGSAVANITTDTLSILGGAGISTAVVGDTLTITGVPSQNLWETITSDSGSAVANTITDTLSILGGSGISTSVSGDTLTIVNASPNADQNLFESVASDSGTAVADSATDTLSIIGGAGVSTSVSGDTLTVDAITPAPTWLYHAPNTGNLAPGDFLLQGISGVDRAWTSVNAIYLRRFDNGGTDMFGMLANIRTGDTIYLKDATDSNNSALFVVASSFYSAPDTLFNIAVALGANAYTGLVPLHTAETFFTFVLNGNQPSYLFESSQNIVTLPDGNGGVGAGALVIGDGAVGGISGGNIAGDNVIVIGNGATTSLSNFGLDAESVIIGHDAIGGGGSIAIGAGAHGRAQQNDVISRNIAIGHSSYAGGAAGSSTYRYNIAIGNLASAEYQESIAIGSSAIANSLSSIAIGTGAQSDNQPAGVAIGFNATTGGNGAIAIGSATAGGTANIAIGTGASATGLENSISIGPEITNTADYELHMGIDNTHKLEIVTKGIVVGNRGVNGSLSVRSFLNYEDWVNDNDDIPNKKYVDNAIDDGFV